MLHFGLEFKTKPTFGDYIEFATDAINNGNPNTTIERSMIPKIRYAILTSCDSGCDFCHLEGEKTKHEIGTLNDALAGWKNKSSLPIVERFNQAVTLQDVENLILVCRLIGANGIHITGGEPSLHPELPEIIRMIAKAGLKVSLTTHAEYGEKKMSRIVSSGVNSLNISLHALTSSDYLSMDLVALEKSSKLGQAEAVQYSDRRLKHKLTNLRKYSMIAESDEDLVVKVNTVVLDPERTISIIEFCNEHGIECRLQKNLNEKEQSDEKITELLRILNAELIAISYSDGDSTRNNLKFRYSYGGSTGEFIIKEERIHEVYFDELCNGCDLKGTNECRERFYGLRADSKRGTLCMDSRALESTINLNDHEDRLLNALRLHYSNAIVSTIIF